MQHWTNYWKNTTALNSFAEGEQGSGYSDEIAEFWNSKFKSIPSGSTVVDLGTGNGAVAVIAQQYSDQNDSNFSVFGIDAADISPEKIPHENKSIKQALNKIHFVPNTLIEESKFEPNTVDFFFSQFAFEYSTLEKSIKHCSQCLKEGGKIILLSHHPDSDISQDSQVGAEVIKYILTGTPLFMQTGLLLEIVAQQTQAGQMHNWKSNPYRHTITTTIQWILSQLKEKYSSPDRQNYWSQTVVNKVASILNQIGKTQPSQLKQHLDQTYIQLQSHYQRLEDQNMAAMDNVKLSTLKKLCVKNNLHLEVKDFLVEGKLFAYHFDITK